METWYLISKILLFTDVTKTQMHGKLVRSIDIVPVPTHYWFI